MRDTPRTDVETYELDYKVLIPREGGEWVKADFARELERALTALVAERDELKEKAKMLDTVIGERNEYEAITNDLRIQLDSAKSFWRDRAERRDAEQKSAADRDLRERLVCAIWPEIMRQWREFKTAIDPRGDALADALIEADKMLAAMRKGEADGR